MNKILIKNAIESRKWFHCSDHNIDDEEIVYKIRLNDFFKLDKKKLDNCEEVEDQELFQNGDIWILNIEVVPKIRTVS
jgi:hypothetical protein